MRINGRTLYEIIQDKKENDIYLYHESLEESISVKKLLEIAGIYVNGIAIEAHLHEEDSCSENEFLSFSELSCLKGRNILIIYLGDNLDHCYDSLIKYGFKPAKNIKWIKRYCVEKLTRQYCFDPINGFNKLGNFPEYPGYHIYGDPHNKNSKIICIYGGSSTDSDWHYFKSWPEILYDICKENSHDVVIMNGGVMGYAVQQELLKALRDVPIIKPSIVISFSGVNNNHLVNEYPFLTDFNLKVTSIIERELPEVNLNKLCSFSGLKTPKETFNRYEFWINFEKVMEYYCRLYGSRFWGVLQPNLMSKKRLLSSEKEYLANRSFMGRMGLTPDEYRNITKGFRSYVEKEKMDWLVDMSDIFDDEQESVYLDGIHVNERGNYITAENIYDLIKYYL